MSAAPQSPIGTPPEASPPRGLHPPVAPTSAIACAKPVRPAPRLRLSVILKQLRDEAYGNDGSEASADAALPVGLDAAASPPSGDAAADERAPGDKKQRRRTPSHVTVGEIVDRTREAGFGVILAFLAICSVPFPGVSVPFGLVIAYGAVQMIIGMHKPWVPRSIRQRRISLAVLDWISVRIPRWTSWLEVLVRPRFTIMTRGIFWTLCGVGILIQAIGLSLPLPIPGSNLFFVVPIVLYAIALLETDGLLMLVAYTVTVYQVVFLIKFWDTLVGMVRAALAFFGVHI